MTRNAKVGEYIIVNAQNILKYLIEEMGKLEVIGVCEEGVVITEGTLISHKDYTLVEDTMKAEDIDLSVDQVFEEPLDGFEFTDCETPLDSEWRRYFLKGVMSANGKSNYWDERLTCWKYCRPIAKPEPKTRPMTNLEVFQLMPIGTVLFLDTDTDSIGTGWCTMVMGIKPRKYTIIDQAFKDLKNLDDIEWMKMEVKE